MDRDKLHLTRDEIESYLRRDLSASDLLSADDHLAGCDECHAKVQAIGNITERAISLNRGFASPGIETDHLTFEQLSDIVDDRFDEIDREIVLSHIELCSRCRRELTELRAFTELREPSNVEVVRPVDRNIRRDRLRAWWQSPRFQVPAFATAAAVLVLIVVSLIIVPLRRENTELRERVAGLERSKQELEMQAESLRNDVASLRSLNEELLSQPAAETTVVLNDSGGQITLDSNGNIGGIQTSQSFLQTIKGAIETQRVKVPAEIADLRGKSGIQMGGSDRFDVLSPVGVVIRSDRPVLKWSPLEGATSYTAIIYDSQM